ncbi:MULTISPECIES: hypothetical protein [unclassified Fibrobacter]|uniref:hypothetical protein n=1 Tax=unclassified Fibrobacter TaxID=2634177 RepID=UPI000D6C5882|nr:MULTISPECIES: hypothetical protein [unclassified Fibrobacter]PWJ68518.1 hypothetical protein BGX12_10744 [Fibrobacter sp. UWR4]PZW72090.1 hypothetical protein C8E88_100862 [Fibrobacter sp. UWR1]
MKKLLGLALIGLMAGTAGAADRDTTIVKVVKKGTPEQKTLDYGAIQVTGSFYPAEIDTIKKSCDVTETTRLGKKYIPVVA